MPRPLLSVPLTLGYADDAIHLAHHGDDADTQRFCGLFGMSLSDVLDCLWCMAEDAGRDELAARIGLAFNYLIGRDA